MAALVLLPLDGQLGEASIGLAEFGTAKRNTHPEKNNPERVYIVLETCAHAVLRWPARREYINELQLELWHFLTTPGASSNCDIAFVHPVGPEFIEAAYGEG